MNSLFSRFADQDNVTKCLSIASVLAKKTVLDVAYRIRWMSDLEVFGYFLGLQNVLCIHHKNTNRPNVLLVK